MILQALTAHYETLVARGELASPGWSKAKISYALCINGAGELEDTVSLQVDTRQKEGACPPRNGFARSRGPNGGDRIEFSLGSFRLSAWR